MLKQSAISNILPVTAHTDFVGKNTTFVATPGSKQDGINFVAQALQRGASKIVIQKNSLVPENIQNSINIYKPEIIHVDDCRQALSELSAKAWGYPAKKLNIIGITGTKGKTTSVYLMHHILSSAGYKTAMISGVENIINKKKYEASLTTPLPDYLHAFFYKCVAEGVQFVVMEASAQAFSLMRLSGVEFSGAIFTNLDLEHSEFYPSMDDYFNSKCMLFKQLKEHCPAIINVDNSWGEKLFEFMRKNSRDTKSNSIISSICQRQMYREIQPNYNFKILKNNSSGLEILISYQNKEYIFSSPNLVGDFNAYNLAGAISLSLELGIYPKTIIDALINFDHVPGRMERYMLANGAMAVIDYAHNPSSFNQILPILKNMTDNLIVVFGCGGDRDKHKRPIMGALAANIADKVIITSDNPRTENLDEIINQIYSGVPQDKKDKVIIESDRAKAIEIGYKLSKKESIIAILGKGPDEYQIFGNEKFYFSDKETILNSSKSSQKYN